MTNIARNLRSSLLLFLLAMSAGSQAGSSPTTRPDGSAIPQPNAVLTDDCPYLRSTCQGEDLRVVAYCTDLNKIDERRRGDFVYTSFIATFTVLHVELGRWASPTISFKYTDSWPTPESGILLDKCPLPYRPGSVLAISLRSNHNQPPTVIAFTSRSPLSPVAEPSHLHSLSPAERTSLILAAEDYAKSIGIAKSTFCVIDANASSYVLQRLIWSADGKPILYLIDRQTRQIQPFEPRQSPTTRPAAGKE